MKITRWRNPAPCAAAPMVEHATEFSNWIKEEVEVPDDYYMAWNILPEKPLDYDYFAAKLYHSLYPRSNFYSKGGDTHRQFVQAVKELLDEARRS